MMLALTKAYIVGFYAQSPSFGFCERKTQQGWDAEPQWEPGLVKPRYRFSE